MSDTIPIIEASHFLMGFGILLMLLIGTYASRYYQVQRNLFYLLLAFFTLSFGVVIYTTDWIYFLIAWEGITIITTAMILLAERRLAAQYFLIQFVGSNILYFAIIMALGEGYSNIVPLEEPWLQMLFILGLGTKSALLGLHFWLPPVHSRAHAPVSALLSGWSVNVGFVMMLRLLPEGNNILFFIGLAMIFYGGAMAFFSTDYKVLLAYSTLSQLGYIALGIGSGTLLGQIGAVLHMVVHGIAKTTLFLGSGLWEKECNGRIIYRFERAFYRHPVNAVSTIAGFSSLMGMVFLAGFHTKNLIKHGTEDIYATGFLLYGATLITVLYAMRFLWWGILKDMVMKSVQNRREKITCTYPPSVSEHVPLIIGTALLLAFGIYPPLMYMFLQLEDPGIVILWWPTMIENILFLVVGIALLALTEGLFFPLKPVPSLNRMLGLVITISQKVSNSIFQLLFPSFQYQLLWIPLIILFLLLWTNFI